MCGRVSQGPKFAARDGVGQGEGVAAEHVDVLEAERRQAALVHYSGCGRAAVAWRRFKRSVATLACRGGSSGSAPSRRPYPRSSGQAGSGREACCR